MYIVYQISALLEFPKIKRATINVENCLRSEVAVLLTANLGCYLIL